MLGVIECLAQLKINTIQKLSLDNGLNLNFDINSFVTFNHLAVAG